MESEPECGRFGEWLTSVGHGWWLLLADAHLHLSAAWPDYRVQQVKEKWGGLRIYLDYPMQSPELWRLCDPILAQIEDRSRLTCEDCGNPGMRRETGWVKTLCDDCSGGAPASTLRSVRSGPVTHHWREPEEPLQ